MIKDDFGVWSIVVPPVKPGICAIPHDSKIKVRGYDVQIIFPINRIDFYDFAIWGTH